MAGSGRKLIRDPELFMSNCFHKNGSNIRTIKNFLKYLNQCNFVSVSTNLYKWQQIGDMSTVRQWIMLSTCRDMTSGLVPFPMPRKEIMWKKYFLAENQLESKVFILLCIVLFCENKYENLLSEFSLRSRYN